MTAAENDLPLVRHVCLHLDCPTSVRGRASQAILRFRAQARDALREVSLDQAMEQSSSRLNVWLEKQQSSPSRRAASGEQAARLAAALSCLAPAQREAIELHHLQGMPLAEVGERMNRDKGAVAALILRGTKRLRELLDNQRGDFDV